MGRPHRFTLPVILALTWAAAFAQGTTNPTDQVLLEMLRGGGYNIYFRHFATDWSNSDRVRAYGDWTSCEAQRMRQLADSGRRDARAVGAALRTLGVPVGRVVASPYCRTVESAKLMGVGSVQTSSDIMNLRVGAYFGGRDAIIERARARLATPPAPGTNTVLVAHGNVAREATPVYPDEGEGVVFRPDGVGGFSVAGRLSASRWVELAGALKPPASTSAGE